MAKAEKELTNELAKAFIKHNLTDKVDKLVVPEFTDKLKAEIKKLKEKDNG